MRLTPPPKHCPSQKNVKKDKDKMDKMDSGTPPPPLNETLVLPDGHGQAGHKPANLLNPPL